MDKDRIIMSSSPGTTMNEYPTPMASRAGTPTLIARMKAGRLATAAKTRTLLAGLCWATYST
jgi:hypothetical protein